VQIDDRIVPATGEVVVGPGRRRVEIEFTACSLRAPERVAFDIDWMGLMSNGSASRDAERQIITIFCRADITFRVSAHNGSLDGGSSEASVFLVVQPYF
jgi:hypothetical protein